MATNRAEIELKASICTDTPKGADLFSFGDRGATHIENNGIERNGGITPIRESDIAVDALASSPTAVVCANGKTLIYEPNNYTSVFSSAGDWSSIYLKDKNGTKKQIGMVSSYGIEQNRKFSNIDDSALSADGTLLTFKYVKITSQATVIISEYSISTGALLNTRSANVGPATLPISTNLLYELAWMAVVKYAVMHYADTFTFLFRKYEDANVYKCTEGGSFGSLTASIYSNNQVFAYKFENGYALIGNIDQKGSTWEMYNTATWTVIATYTNMCYVTFQYYNSNSRAIITKIPYVNPAASYYVETIGLLGYTDFSTFSSSIVFANDMATTAKTITDGYELGYAYVNLEEKPATGFYYNFLGGSFLCSKATVGTGTWHSIMDYRLARYYSCGSGRLAMAGAYGKLSGGFSDGGTTTIPAVPFHFRFNMIGGIPSYLSVAWESILDAHFPDDCLGVPLTSIGEIDQYYPPQVDMASSYKNSTILYKYNNDFIVIRISKTPSNIIQEINTNIHKINTIFPLNVIDAIAEKIELGANDYNGRTIFQGTGTPSATSLKYSCVLRRKYGQSIDTGDKIATLASGFVTTYPLGFFLPNDPPNLLANFEYDIFQNDTYLMNQDHLINPDKIGSLYITDPMLPIALGSIYRNGIASTLDRSIFICQDHMDYNGDRHVMDGYEIGNDILGTFQTFKLFGQQYVFDGHDIYSINFYNDSYNGKTFVAHASGLTYIASSPVAIYFLSAFDNSIWTFDGGRVVSKGARMNDEETIIDGFYNERDGALCLETANYLLWIRDGIVSRTAKKTGITNAQLFSTDTGIWLLGDYGTNKRQYQYTFLADATVTQTTVPLIWQSGYFGVLENKLGLVSAFIVRVFSASRVSSSFTITLDGYDTDGETHDDFYFKPKAGDWTPLGFFTARIVPKHTLGLGISIGMKTSDVLVLNRVIAEFTPHASATPAADRSK